jgi:hypothetical protein
VYFVFVIDATNFTIFFLWSLKTGTMPARAVELSATYLKCDERLQAVLFAPMAESYASSQAKQRKKKIQWPVRMHTFQMNSLLTLTSLTIVFAHWTIFGADDSHSHLFVFVR